MAKSLASQVLKELEKNPSITVDILQDLFLDRDRDVLKTTLNRAKKKQNKNVPDVLGNKTITMELVEKEIMSGKIPIPLLRLKVDFLKIKQQDQSELKEIDLDKFYKIGVDD